MWMEGVMCVVLQSSTLRGMGMSRYVGCTLRVGQVLTSVVQFGAPTPANDKKMISNEGKMEKSFLNFKVWTFT